MAAVSFAFVGVLVRLASQSLTAWQVSLGRAAFGILAMVAAWRLFKVSIDGPDRRLLLLRGASGTITFVSMIAAMQRLPLGVVMALFFLFPVFAAILSPWINQEAVGGRKWLCIGVSFGGTCLVLAPEAAAFHPEPGHLFALVAAASGGLNVNMVRRLSAGHSPYCIYFYWSLVAAAASLWPAFSPAGVRWPPAALAYLAAIGLTATIGQVSLNHGFLHLQASEGGLVLMTQVPLAAVFGAIFFGEPIGWLFIAGASLILAGGIGLTRAAAAPAPP